VLTQSKTVYGNQQIGTLGTPESPGALPLLAAAGFEAGICSSRRLVKAEVDPKRSLTVCSWRMSGKFHPPHMQVCNAKGEMVPIRVIMAPELQLGPQLLQRDNNYRSLTVQGGPAESLPSW